MMVRDFASQSFRGCHKLVPTCTNGVTTSPLSQQETQRNWSAREDTRYPRKDEKTP